MVSSYHPIQLVRAVKSRNCMLIVVGARLFSFSLEKMEILDQWMCQSLPLKSQNSDLSFSLPSKKVKLDQSLQETAIEPYISCICLSSDEVYIALATVENKMLIVLQLLENGKFIELSQRSLMKRVSAIIFSHDNKSIICAYKFGECYAIPVSSNHNQIESGSLSSPSETIMVKPSESPPRAVTFQPSASRQTVHTLSNLRALETQLKQKKIPTTSKCVFNNYHQFLLGHASFLSDVIWAEAPDKSHSYLITADRDEHIRISRAPPQCFVIHTNCLGHTNFVSKLCLICSNKYLVSCGGDNDLFVWDWPEGKLVGRTDVKSFVMESLNIACENSDKYNISVVGLMSFIEPLTCEEYLLVWLEGHTLLLMYDVNDILNETTVKPHLIKLSGNVLHATIIDNFIYVTLDTIYPPDDITNQSLPYPESVPLISAIQVNPHKAPILQICMGKANDIICQMKSVIAQTQRNSQIMANLYPWEGVRKRCFTQNSPSN